MRLQKLIFLFIFIINFSGFKQSFAVDDHPYGVIRLIPQIQGGAGDYFNPYVIYTDIIEWRLDETHGFGKENATYSTEIHMARHRSCAIVTREDNLIWNDLQGRVFRWKGMAGVYYVKITIYHGGDEFETKVYVHCKVPPVNRFNLPYTPPANNRPSVPVANIVNKGGGSGSYGDPYKINSPIIRFVINDTYDPDGKNDIVNGVCYWAIYTDGHHPVYSSAQQHERDPAKTFLYFDDFENKVFEWDTRKRPSADGQYRLVLIVMDQWGELVEDQWHFIIDAGASAPTPQLMVSPTSIELKTGTSQEQFSVRNIGDGQLNWQAHTNQSWITQISPNQGTLNKDEMVNVLVSVDPVANTGGEQGVIQVESNGGSKKIELMTVNDNTPPEPPKMVQVKSP